MCASVGRSCWEFAELHAAFGYENEKTRHAVARTLTQISDSETNMCLLFFRAREQRKARGPESPPPGPAQSPLSL